MKDEKSRAKDAKLKTALPVRPALGLFVARILLISMVVLMFASVALAQHAGHGGKQPGAVAQKQGPAQAETPPTISISPEKLQLIGVRTAVADFRRLEKHVRTVGKVAPDETRLAFVTTKVSGWVTKLLIDYTGQKVEEGQPLLSLYSPDLVSAEEEYLLALRAVKSAPTGTGGFAEVDASREQLLESAKRRLRLWDITDKQIEELEKTGKPKTDITLHAPFSGIVLEKTVLDGAYITPGMNLYKIADLSSVWILADVYEYEVPLVRVGQKALVTLPYYSGEALSAAVNYIYPVLDPATRTVKVRLTVHNPGLMLKPDMFTNVDIAVASGMRLSIPTEAVLDSGLRQIVYVEKTRGLYEMRVVKLGIRTDQYVEVLKGVRKGERVVTSGNFLIDSESQLRTGGQ